MTGSLEGIIKGLHVGRLGNMDITWAIDAAAISIIFLTVSGIYLSIKILRADKKRKKRQNPKLQS
jgi:hypothetical protein